MGRVHSKVYDRCYSNFENVYYLAKLTVIIWAYCVHLYLDTSLKSKFLIWWTIITSDAHPSQMLNYWASTTVMFYWINNSLYQLKSYGWPKVHVSCLQIFPQFHWKQWQSIEANGKIRSSLCIIMMICPLHFSWTFVFNFSLEYDSRSKRSVLRIPLANQKDEL